MSVAFFNNATFQNCWKQIIFFLADDFPYFSHEVWLTFRIPQGGYRELVAIHRVLSSFPYNVFSDHVISGPMRGLEKTGSDGAAKQTDLLTKWHGNPMVKSNFGAVFWYWCYYPHRSRNSVSLVCGILTNSFIGQQFKHRLLLNTWRRKNPIISFLHACICMD